jgi:hypothetical protein
LYYFHKKLKIKKKTKKTFSVGFLGGFLVFLGVFFSLPTLAPGGRAHLSRLPHGGWSRGLSSHLLVQIEDDEQSRLLLLAAGEDVNRVKCLKTRRKKQRYIFLIKTHSYTNTVRPFKRTVPYCLNLPNWAGLSG